MRTGRPIENASKERDRFAVILGENRLADKVSALCGVDRRTFYKWERTSFPPRAITLLEILEQAHEKQGLNLSKLTHYTIPADK